MCRIWIPPNSSRSLLTRTLKNGATHGTLVHGAEKVDQFQLEIFDTERFAIVVRSFDGNALIFYNNDIATNDLEETMARFGLPVPSPKKPAVKPTVKPTAKPTPKPTPKPAPVPADGKGNCTTCDGDGKCNNCGGDMWLRATSGYGATGAAV